MRKKYFILMFMLLILFILNSQDNNQKPAEAPEGYKWSYFKEIKGYFLVPDSWFLNFEKKDNTYAYFISKEDYTKKGFYKTGISINVITNIKKVNSFEYIKMFKEELKKKVEVINESDLIEYGPFKQFILLYKSFSSDLDKNIKIHKILISNVNTNSLYFIMFETPEDEWETNWKIAEKILELFGIDDEV